MIKNILNDGIFMNYVRLAEGKSFEVHSNTLHKCCKVYGLK